MWGCSDPQEQLFRRELLQQFTRSCLGPAIWNAADPRQLHPHLSTCSECQEPFQARIPSWIAGAVRKSEVSEHQAMPLGQEQLCRKREFLRTFCF
ncbi:hypothetical protein AC628_20715 [Bradyrhizobium sp. NAS96.2]|nr:hypothetical protein AC628_20715 [Bradyrhizobium sp. NAS96.2]